MKKRGISPEYKQVPVPGSFNMKEQKSFMGSKMMSVEDTIILGNRDVVYYQQPNGEQIDLVQESNISPKLYSISQDKFSNHSFGFDPNQSDDERNNKTNWMLELNMKNVLSNYIYSQIKSARTFEYIRNKDTSSKSVNESIYDYIDINIINRYQYDTIDFFIKYVPLNETEVSRFEVKYDPSIESEENKFTNIRITYSDDNSMARIFFNQQKSSVDYTIKYYFNIKFTRK